MIPKPKHAMKGENEREDREEKRRSRREDREEKIEKRRSRRSRREEIKNISMLMLIDERAFSLRRDQGKEGRSTKRE